MRFPLSSGTPSQTAEPAGRPDAPSRARVLWLSCVAHALHDGYSDMIYVLLPVWQGDFGLSYGALAMLRGLYSGTMASLQLTAGQVADRFGTRATLALGTLLAALGYVIAGFTGSLLGLCIALAISGSGSSTQHPLASGAVSRTYADTAKGARGPLGTYNFAGDLGKAALPAAISLLITLMPWRHALWIVSALGLLVAAAIALWLPSIPRDVSNQSNQSNKLVHTEKPAESSKAIEPSARVVSTAFSILLSIGILDSAVRMGLLTFLPFILKAKGISPAMLGTAMALVFIGGAAGKFACGWLGARMGVVGTVLATEGGTAVLIVAVMFSPLPLTLVLLPLLGMMLNGTSSVLYGTVPELTPAAGIERAFALFYTGTIASGAIAPVMYGFLGDHIGVHAATYATALTALAIFPLALALRTRLVPHQAPIR